MFRFSNQEPKLFNEENFQKYLNFAWGYTREGKILSKKLADTLNLKLVLKNK